MLPNDLKYFNILSKFYRTNLFSDCLLKFAECSWFLEFLHVNISYPMISYCALQILSYIRFSTCFWHNYYYTQTCLKRATFLFSYTKELKHTFAFAHLIQIKWKPVCWGMMNKILSRVCNKITINTGSNYMNVVLIVCFKLISAFKYSRDTLVTSQFIMLQFVHVLLFCRDYKKRTIGDNNLNIDSVSTTECFLQKMFAFYKLNYFQNM